jgi:cysteine desulfurase
MSEIYLDNAATTRPDPLVVEAVARAMGDGFGNASSSHRRGVAATRAVEEATDEIAKTVGGGEWRVLFTSGGSESDTWAVLGSVPRGKRRSIVTTSLEHAAIEGACRAYEATGERVTRLGGGLLGLVAPREAAAAVDEHTGLVSATALSAELGTVQPFEEIARRVKERSRRVRVHIDGVQALAQLRDFAPPRQVDMVSVSAHKIHGPQGIGALLVRPGVSLRPLIHGGDQQEGLRPGTLNLPGIVGFGVAARLHRARRVNGSARLRELSGNLRAALTGTVAGVRSLGDSGAWSPGTVVLAIEGVASEVLLHALEMRGVLVSAGSACHSRRSEPPRCLVEAGLSEREGAVRFSLSFDTTQREIDEAAAITQATINAVRSGQAGKL